MNQQRKVFAKSVLEDLYLVQQKNPSEIANIFKCDHKTIRKNLKIHNIPLRTRSEYNALSHKTYTEPDNQLLFTKESLILHSIYKCEGINTDKSKGLSFVNQDPNLIKSFYDGLIHIYKYESTITLNILYNFDCTDSVETVKLYQLIFKDFKVKLFHTPSNKNPIIRINAGGKHLYNLFKKNTNIIFNSIPLII